MIRSLPEQRRTGMNAANPRYVLRNYLAQQAIDLAEQGDDTAASTNCSTSCGAPTMTSLAASRYAQKRPDWASAGKPAVRCSHAAPEGDAVR